MDTKYTLGDFPGVSREQAKGHVGEGWHALVDKVYDALPYDTKITQVKEKFGGLRIYCWGADEEFLDFLIDIENESFTICEECGKPGKRRPDLGWVKTLCDTHYVWRKEKKGGR